MSKDLLLEIGTEEIPARFLDGAIAQMASFIKANLNNLAIPYGEIKTFATPRRLTLYVQDISESQHVVQKEIIGPPERNCFDSNNQPTKIASGFAKSHNVDISELKTKVTPKGKYIYLIKIDGNKETSLLLQQILPNLITSLSFPKSMRWGEGDFRFARPIHWILALFGTEVIKFSLSGIESSNITFGHRFLSDNKRIEISTCHLYQDELKKVFVIVDQGERKKIIEDQLNKLELENGIKVVKDSLLLDLVTNLVEYPVALLGKFDQAFLKLPHEVLITSMREHQKYFSVQDQSGNLLPDFVTISNIKTTDPGEIRKGNERVLRARLADARYFFEEDKKIPLINRLDNLKGMIFQDKLGTYYDKIKRLNPLSQYLANKLGLDSEGQEKIERVVNLCKNDLTTCMVGEFPELQGIMGKEYAFINGEDQEVAEAVFEHYLPREVNDRLPRTIIGDIVSISDKIDNLVCRFALGWKPSGSQDPYGLRRQVLGIINIIIEKRYPLSLRKILGEAAQLLEDKIKFNKEGIIPSILSFIRDRIYYLFIDRGFRYDLINSALAVNFDDLSDFNDRLLALSKLQGDKDFQALTTGFRRIIKILPQDLVITTLDPLLFKEEEETELYNYYLNLKIEVDKDLLEKKYYEALGKIATLRRYVDNFFDKVMVMVENKEVRLNRLNLLYCVSTLFGEIGDFSKVQVE
ncbi:MAG: glycine--tRNA ligase subunit beta [bacterium]